MRALARSGGVAVDKMVGVYMGRDRLTFGEIEVMPVVEFLARLHAGRVF